MIGLIKKCEVAKSRKDKISICYLLANLMIYKNKQTVKSSIEIYENPINEETHIVVWGKFLFRTMENIINNILCMNLIDHSSPSVGGK